MTPSRSALQVGLPRFPESTGTEEARRRGEALGWSVRLLDPQAPLPPGLDLVLLPGGDPSPAKLAAQAASPLGRRIGAFSAAGGRVLGLGAGFALLCDLGLLPGHLAPNPDGRLRHGPVSCRLEPALGPWRPGTRLTLPLATRAGRYEVAPEVLVDLELEGRVLLRFCGPAGEIGESWNPLGAQGAVAGLRDASGRVVGLIPQLERLTAARDAGPLLQVLAG